MDYIDRRGAYHKLPLGEKSSPRVSVYGAYIKDDKILLTLPTWIELWELPGGGQDPGETVVDTLKREFIEETGSSILEFEKNPYAVCKLGFYADDLKKYFDATMYYYIVTQIGPKEKERITFDEVADVKWMSISEITKKNMNNFHYNAIAELLKPYQKLD